MSIGIIAAENEEMMAIKNLMTEVEENKKYNLTFLKGKIKNKECVLVECGVGKVNAARTTQILIDNYDIECVINVGSAGAVNEELNVEDIVIGNKLVQYDFDITQIGNYEKGEICDVGKYMISNERLIKICEETMESFSDRNYKIKIGIIASADMFCAEPEKAKEIRKDFNAECVEMEGAAVAQVCFLDNIPFVVIRAISDTPNGNNKIDFHTFLKIASKRASEIINEIVEKI